MAGDYTKQKYLASMEGAVFSGKLCTEVGHALKAGQLANVCSLQCMASVQAAVSAVPAAELVI